MQQPHHIFLPLIRIGVPSLNQLQNFNLSANGHAIVAKQILNKVNREGRPPWISRNSTELGSVAQHVTCYSIHQVVARMVLSALDRKVLEVIECIGECLLSADIAALGSKPVEQLLKQHIYRILLCIVRQGEHLFDKHLSLWISLWPSIEEHRITFVDKSQKLRHALAVTDDFIALTQEEGVSTLDGPSRSTNELCSAETRCSRVISLHHLRQS
mmetsp:Transcript_62652/g.149451  ORF Transcript_62652/g.149451 Transcript_62652/m.149451 type:complete len:214 (+) Transcript_62652:891-1532(+)